MKKLNLMAGGHLPASEDMESPSVSPRRRRRKKRGLSPLLIIVPALIIVAASYFLFRLTQATTDFRIPKAAEQIYGGQTFPVQKGSVISVDRNGEASLIREHTTVSITSIPIYYESENTLITAYEYSYINPRTHEDLSVSMLTELSVTDEGAVTLKHDTKEKQTQNGFLYDGADLFIFLEPVTVTFNGYTFNLGRMSYVEADYRNNIMVYDRATGETFMESATTAVVAFSENEDYNVSLLGSSYIDKEGNKYLLINDTKLLDPLI